jgi:hypothetical protein
MRPVAKTMLGLLVAPAVPALVLFAVQWTLNSPGDAVRAAGAVAIFGYAAAFLFGVPAHALLRRAHVRSLIAYAGMGALIGLAVYGVIFLPQAVQNARAGADAALLMLRNTAGFAVLGALSGLLASAVFWSIAVRAGEPG